MGGSIPGFLYRQLTFCPKPLPTSVNLQGQAAIITGSNVGLGLEAAKQLSARGLSHLILAVRTVSKGEAAKEEILRDNPSSTCTIEVWELDQESFDSVRAFGERAQALQRLDLVILSAGVKLLEYKKAKTGHEMNVQINHLGTSLLSLLLLPVLQKTASTQGTPSRLTIVTSEMHFWSKFPEKDSPNTLSRLDDPDSFKPGMDRYNTSKLLNVLWLRELSKRAGPDVVVNGVNPGLCASELHRSDSTPGKKVFNGVVAWSPAQGGHCLVDAVVLHKEERGAYVSEQVVKRPSSFVLSEEGEKAQVKLWEETVALLKEAVPGMDLLGGIVA
ncbi:6-phosphogluconolactonase sol3 [Aspergillus melleus]|uniref:6-phosphogluconolactonase sol3 n=1 Tax=Aspergillus melleus TaxID=138277 RepID=UPI001E8E9F5B|nr:6-phosphogluconolactonase sol3 [Aspergillus melleus]KAH8435028.1 6-phosphogluconolactonase sol3 [Aspergillus melleus]